MLVGRSQIKVKVGHRRSRSEGHGDVGWAEMLGDLAQGHLGGVGPGDLGQQALG
jgi:hypothetical protein